MTRFCIYPVIPSVELPRSRDFYRDLLGLRTTFEADWYISLIVADGDAQIAFVERGHESIPEGYRAPAAGTLATVEVEDVDAVYERARALSVPIAYDLRSEDWGQRHFMVVDPNGLLVDVVTQIPASPEFEAQYAGHATAE